MAFEELPAEFDAFFKSGDDLALPPSLKAEYTPPPVAAPSPAPAAAPAPTPAPEAAAPTPAPAAVPDAPVAPTSNPYLERLLAEKDAQVSALADQMKALQAQITKAQEVPAPDPSVDPLGHMTHQMNKLQEQLATLTEQQSAALATQQQQTQGQQFMAGLRAQINEFETTHTDYQDAYRHLIAVRTQDFKEMGYTDQQVKTAIGNEEMQITKQAMALGKNPAEMVYNFSKRYGFQAKAPTPAPENKLDTIRKGMEASQTLDRSTPPDAGKITTDNIAAASEAQINKMVNDDWEGLFGKTKNGLF